MKYTKLLFFFTFLTLTLQAQKEWSNWYYNGRFMLTFKNGYPQLVTNFINPVPSQTDYFHFYNWGDGGISYSDPVTGEMKFIISNRLGFDKTYNDFPNDTLLRSCPDLYSYRIIPFSSNPNKFYVVQFQDVYADLLAQETGLQVRCPNAIGLGYSLVDLSLNNGLGDFINMNQVVGQGYTSQITTVRHDNGRDVWVIVHPYGTSRFDVILFTDNGVQPAVSNIIGPFTGSGSRSSVGTLIASHDGKLLAGYSTMDAGIQLFDFDKSTGLLSNYRTLPFTNQAVEFEFSPDNSKLYFIGGEGIYQYDFNSPDVASSLTKIFDAGIYNNLYDMQLAPDGKIYVNKTGEFVTENYTEYTGAIECPNLPQYACNFNPKALPFAYVAFPNLINDFINDPHAPPVTKFDLGKDTAVCFGSYTITAPPRWQSYRWNTGETTSQITVTKAGLYYVLTGNTGFSCPTGYGYINIGDKAEKLNLGKDTALCKGIFYSLHVDNNYNSILWGSGSKARDSVITTASNIIISANDKNGCYTKDTILVDFKYYPIADFGSDTTLCNNETLTLQLYPQSNPFFSGSYIWQDSSRNDKFTVTVPGIYTGSSSYDGCTVSDTIKVSYVNAQNAELGNDTTICEGDSLLLKVNIGNASFLWNTGDTTSYIFVKTAGQYTVRVSNTLCTQSDTINVSVNSKPNFSLGNDTVICENEQLTVLPLISEGIYLWQDGSAGFSYKVNAPGLYWLQFTQNGCSNRDSINVLYKKLPEVNLGNDTGICQGSSLLLNAFNTGIMSYRWQDQSTNSFFSAVNNGEYGVRVTGTNGCINSDTIKVNVIIPPVFSLGSDTVLCDTKTLLYNFRITGATYLWSSGNQTNSYTVTSAGIYSLTVTQSGCSKSDTVKINYKPLPAVNLGMDTSICEGATLTLNATNSGAAYLWNDNSTQPVYNVTAAGAYSVKVKLNGCYATDTIKIFYNRPPQFTLGRDTLICSGQQLLLRPSSNETVSYLWQDGSTNNYFNVTTPGIYRLYTTNKCGTATDEIEIISGLCLLEMPNSFTPNNDGLNDLFRVKYPEFIKDFHMIIYNRWGQEIFETNNPVIGWDGTYKSNPQGNGTYIWTITLTDIQNHNQTSKGTITLIR